MIIKRRKYNKITKLINFYNLLIDINWTDDNFDKISNLNIKSSSIIKSYGKQFNEIWMRNQIAIQRSGLFEDGLSYARKEVLISLYNFINNEISKRNYDLSIILPNDFKIGEEESFPKMLKVKSMLDKDNDIKSS